MRGLLSVLMLGVMLGGIGLSGREAVAQEGAGCQQPVVGRYDVDATLLFPFGPTWALRISRMDGGTFAIEIPDVKVSFRSLRLERRELAGRSTDGQARISLIFDEPTGKFEGMLWLPPEVLPWKLVGTPSDRAQVIAWENYEDCVRANSRSPKENAAVSSELETLRGQLETLRRDYSVERQRVSDAQAERARLTALAASQQEVIQNLSANSRTAEAELTRARRDIARLEQEAAELRRSAPKPAGDPASAERIQTLNSEVQNLRGQIDKLEAGRAELEGQARDLRIKLESGDQAGMAKITSLESDLNACRMGNRTEELTAQLVELDGVLQQTRGLNNRLTAALSACQAPPSR